MIALAWNLTQVRRFTVDDVYITLRYSRHLAQGLGAVYNTTGPRAEGYTSFSWMALLAVPHLLHLDALLVAKALGVLATIATCVLVGAWVYTELGESTRIFSSAAAVAAYAVLPRTAIHAVTGMETALFTLTLTAMLFTSTQVVRRGKKWILSFALTSLAAALTRPEANMAVLVTAIATAVLAPPPLRRSFAATTVLWCGVPLAVYQLVRIRYYGLFAPLPFYVKVSSPGTVPGLAPVGEWLLSELRYAIPIAFVLAARRRHLLPLLVAVLALAAFFIFPQHLMGYANRYLAPLDPALCGLFGVGLGCIMERMRGPAVVAVVPALLALPVALSLHEARAAIDEQLTYADGLAAAHESLGSDLAKLHRPNARVATSDAGAIPYLSGWWALDLLGLNDAHIAVTGDHDPKWVLEHQLDALILVSTERDRFVPYDWNAFERPLFDAATVAGFTKVDARAYAPDYWLWMLVRPGFSGVK